VLGQKFSPQKMQTLTASSFQFGGHTLNPFGIVGHGCTAGVDDYQT
jgi:hypothetical protein